MRSIARMPKSHRYPLASLSLQHRGTSTDMVSRGRPPLFWSLHQRIVGTSLVPSPLREHALNTSPPSNSTRASLRLIPSPSP